MKTFAQLKQNVRDRLWPSGDPENLAAVHDKMVVEALIELQQLIGCLQYNNSELVPHCETLFQSGMTVFQAPRGAIKAVHVVDRVNSNGVEDDSYPLDWDSRIFYRNVSHPNLEAVALGPQPASCTSVWQNLRISCSSLSKKFPAPTDADYVGEKKLPLGYHYSQASTDSAYGRAMQGAWSENRGRIHVFPWIQSTETLLIEWDGIKRVWLDEDPVDDDPTLELAVALYVDRSHAELYETDTDRGTLLDFRYREALARLRHACREETRVRERERSEARQYNEQYSIGSGPVEVGEIDCIEETDDSKIQCGCPAITAPTFWPASGASTLFPTEVALSTGVEGGKIYYAANGKTPNKGSTEYTKPFKVVDGMTIKAVVIDEAGCSSPVAYSAYSSYGTGKFFRHCTKTDRAGSWHTFTSDGGDDWNWKLEFPISGSTEIEHVEVYQTNSSGVWTTGQVWSSKLNVLPPGATETIQAYPLVIDDGNGTQLNHSYVDSLGYFTSNLEWDLHGDINTTALTDMHFLIRVYVGGKTAPVEVLSDGTSCGEQCCSGRCGTKTLGDKFLSIALDRDATTCATNTADTPTGDDPSCWTITSSTLVTGAVIQTATVEGVAVTFEWYFVDSVWTLRNISSGGGNTVDLEGWTSVTDEVNSTGGYSNGSGTVYLTLNGVSTNGRLTINGPAVCTTTTTTTTSATTTLATTTTTTTTSATTTPTPPDCGSGQNYSFWACFQWGDNINGSGILGSITYFSASEGGEQTISIPDPSGGEGCWLVQECAALPADAIDIEYNIDLYYSGGFGDEVGSGEVGFSGAGLPSGTFESCMEFTDPDGDSSYDMNECTYGS